MSLFKSPRERRLWAYALAVLVAIYATLGLARTLSGMLRERGLLSDVIWVGIFLVGATVIIQGLNIRTKKLEIAIWLGITAVYLFILIRMALPEERSHLIEYGVLGVFIYEALKERNIHGGKVPYPALMAIIATALFGVLDECIQALLPQRVFDPLDMLFNAFAGLLAVGSSLLLSWVRGITKL